MEKQKLKHLATALTNNQQILYFDDERVKSNLQNS